MNLPQMLKAKGHAVQALTKGIELLKQNKANFTKGTTSFHLAEPDFSAA
jgi:hypothetical protein